MSNKSFAAIILAVVIGVGGFVVFKQSRKPKEQIIGEKHSSQGEKHIAQNAQHEVYNSSIPSSGSHYANANAPALWGVYTQEIEAEVFLHNEEHGGVVIAYRPDLPPEQVRKLQALFAPPYSTKAFAPSKAILTPRSSNKQPIELAAWTYSKGLEAYDEATITKFYLQHVGKSPEPAAGPNNKPINQAAN